MISNKKVRIAGFSLIELMVSIAIIAIISSIAYPSYMSYIRKSRRAEAISNLLQMQNLLEEYYSQNNSYPNLITAVPGITTTTSNYNYTYTPGTVPITTYTLTATATSASQVKDTGCTVMTIDNLGGTLPTVCWTH